jgi:hypothetical protein
MAFRLDRRTVLRGIGGAIVGLPALECMLDGNGRAYAQSNDPIPKRYAILFAGQSIGGDGWPKNRSRIAGQTIQEEGHFIAPLATGADYAITTPLEPLTNLRGDFSIVSNLRIPFDPNSTDASAVPPGGAYRDFHGGGKSPLLCGVRSTEPAFRCQGITSDQVIANMHAGQTTFASLVLRAQPSWYLSGSSYAGRQYLSYRGPGDRIEAQASPQIAFQSLFQGFTPSGEAEAARFDFRKRSRLSVLDLIGRRRNALVSKVGAADRRRLEQHFDEIRALEERVAAIAPVATGECRVLDDPGTDPAIGGDNAGLTSNEISTNTGYSDEDRRARLMADLIHMAFVCDLTRVATLQITVFQSHMNVYPVTNMLGTPILSDQHEVGHNGDTDNRGQIAVSTVLKWHITHYAYLLQKMKETPEGAGNLLDNSAIVFLPEGGHGTQLNDGSTADQTHSTENMVALIGGRAGGLNPGRHIDGSGAHPAQALISAMQAAGYQGDTLGEVTGNVSELFA